MKNDKIKELTDAGFPFKPGITVPTLSDLIAACGKDFRKLSNYGTMILGGISWWAEGGGAPKKCATCGHIEDPKGPYCQGETPEEAVAMLWLITHRNTK